MNKNASVTMAAAVAVAGILTLSVLAHLAFAQILLIIIECPDPPKHSTGGDGNTHIAMGGGSECASGGAGGAGGEGGQGGKNVAEDNGKAKIDQDANGGDNGKAKIDQDANGGDANGGHGGNANGGNAHT